MNSSKQTKTKNLFACIRMLNRTPPKKKRGQGCQGPCSRPSPLPRTSPASRLLRRGLRGEGVRQGGAQRHLGLFARSPGRGRVPWKKTGETCEETGKIWKMGGEVKIGGGGVWETGKKRAQTCESTDKLVGICMEEAMDVGK